MQRSIDRILTTHVGALQRPPELSKAMAEQGEWAPDVLPRLHAAVSDVVARQERAGIDVVDDGEFGKTLWMWYVRDRMDGIEARDWSPDSEPLLKGRDRDQFPGFYAWADANASIFGYMEDTYFYSPTLTQPVVTGPLRYRPEAVQRDIANLKDALRDNPALEAFMPVVAPASIEVGLGNEYYATRDELMRALADAIRQEYKAIIDAGFILQVDDAWVPAAWDRSPEFDLDSYRAYAFDSIEVLNHALDGLPEDRIRYHLCWGSWHGPHANDIPLADIVDIMLDVRVGAYLIEAANPRHEHEYHLWEDVKLPDGKTLIPGVVTHSTNLIEHPELVAERITRYTDRLGPESVIAGADCGFGSRIHPELGWAKLAALAEGAALASGRIWHR
ncbi:MAG: cobalamin-independent methionine synthase II family protein [Trebonia sp.]